MNIIKLKYFYINHCCHLATCDELKFIDITSVILIEKNLKKLTDITQKNIFKKETYQKLCLFGHKKL